MNDRFTFVVSDGSLNKYGSRVITDGIDLGEFKQNPVMFWNHRRDEDGFLGGSNTRERMPIGRWENIRQDGDRLIADAVIDLNDSTGKKVAEKIENGFLKAASIGIQVTGLSDDPEMMLQGQTRPTITTSKLLEISIVDIPANGNALKLYYTQQSETLCLSLDDQQNVDKFFKMNDKQPTVGEQITNALNGFFDKFKSQFNISPKEEAQIENAAEAQNALFAEFNATIAAIELPAAPDNSAEIAELKASLETLNAANAEQAEQVETMKNEIIELRGQKSGGNMPNDKAPAAGEEKEIVKPSVDEAKFAAAGRLFDKHLKR